VERIQYVGYLGVQMIQSTTKTRCCGNCIHFSVDEWLFPKINGNCNPLRVRYNTKLKRFVDSDSGISDATSTKVDANGLVRHTVFNLTNVPPEREACKRFEPIK
jgi:hypothetical protein